LNDGLNNLQLGGFEVEIAPPQAEKLATPEPRACRKVERRVPMIVFRGFQEAPQFSRGPGGKHSRLTGATRGWVRSVRWIDPNQALAAGIGKSLSQQRVEEADCPRRQTADSAAAPALQKAGIKHVQFPWPKVADSSLLQWGREVEIEDSPVPHDGRLAQTSDFAETQPLFQPIAERRLRLEDIGGG
jgi:hypothetical protein